MMLLTFVFSLMNLNDRSELLLIYNHTNMTQYKHAKKNEVGYFGVSE